MNQKKEKMIKWIKNAGTIDVVYHIDTDGLCSAAQLIKYLKKKGKNYNLISGSPQKMRHSSFYYKLKSELVIFLDLPADHYEDEIYKLNDRADIVIIDHHIMNKDMNSETIAHFNPALDGIDKYCPSSKQVYDLFRKYDWIAAIGVIGDLGGKQWKEWINRVEKRHGLSPCKGEYCLDSEFAKYDHLINASRMIKGEEGSMEALKILVESETFEEFKKQSEKLISWEQEISSYLEELKERFEKDKEENKKLELLTFTIRNPKYSIGSALSTIISMEHYNKTVVLFIIKNSIVNVNFRRQDGKYDMALLAKKSVEGLPKASGGGHPKAAGATVRIVDFAEFRKNIKKNLRAQKKAAK